MELTPKEKAKELFSKYQNIYFTEDSMGIDDELAKQCALITVEEIINSSPSLPILSDAGSFVNDIKESTKYWKEVKKELLKM